MDTSKKRKFANWAPQGVLREIFTAKDFEPNRPDGLCDKSLPFIMQYLRNIKPKLSLDNVTDPADFPAWRTAVRQKLRELMKMRTDFAVPFKLLSDEPRDGYRLQKWEFYPERYLVIPIAVLIPNEVIEKKLQVPAVICNPGSGASYLNLAGEPDNYINAYPFRNRQAWWYCKAGMIGVAVENPATAINAGDEIEYEQIQLRFYSLLNQSGRTYHGFITEQRLMIVDFLKKCPYVDISRIAVSGLSLGCGGVLYSALLSDDISAAVYNDFVCSRLQRTLSTTEVATWPTFVSAALPGALEWFDIQPDITSALAPKPLLLAEGGPWIGHIEKIVRAYKLAGAEDKLTVQYYYKYQNPKNRLHEHEDLMHVTGLDGEKYFEYANVDARQHSFHPEIDVPWLIKVYYMPEPSDFLKGEFEKAFNEQENSFI